jgi:DNA-binding response OmpR family regulator
MQGRDKADTTARQDQLRPLAAALGPTTTRMSSEVAAPSRDILVVEDDPVVSGLIDHMLRRRGFAVRVVADGRSANELLDTMDPPAVVVLDVMLPFVDGFELIERIRHTPRWEAVPIIMLTSKSQESYVIRAFEAGVNDYVVKPFRPEEFVARVRRLAGGAT